METNIRDPKIFYIKSPKLHIKGFFMNVQRLSLRMYAQGYKGSCIVILIIEKSLRIQIRGGAHFSVICFNDEIF